MATPMPLNARQGTLQQDLAADQAATDWYCPEGGGFTATLSGSWTGSVKFQRSFDGGTTVFDYTNLDQQFQPSVNLSTDFVQAEKRTLWRALFNRTSGTATVRFGQ